MKGDFTRDTFDAARHFSRVLMQQGRVTLDADYNEQSAILLHYLRTLARDLIGPYAAPFEHRGFVLSPAENNSNLSIGAGRCYVDGFLVENDQDYLYAASQGKEGAHLPSQPYSQVAESDGLLKALRQNSPDSRFWVYLDVWERHVSFIEDDSIREKALGGPDTCTRAQTVWQVKAAPIDAISAQFEARLKALIAQAGNNPDAETKAHLEELRRELATFQKATSGNPIPATVCGTPLDALTGFGDALLTARVDPGEAADDPCITPPESKYRGAENHLYRVEIHQGGAVGDNPAPTWKWSRDNGSVATRWLGTTGNDVQAGNPRGFEAGNWVEFQDDLQELQGQPGALCKIVKVDGDVLTVDPAPPAWSKNLVHPRLRRWDYVESESVTLAKDNALPVVETPAGTTPDKADWLDLEDGIQIQFAANGNYRTGDYWLIPARVETGNIEWPLDEQGVEIAQPPRGIEHHYAPLGFVWWADGLRIQSCSCVFYPLSDCAGFYTHPANVVDGNVIVRPVRKRGSRAPLSRKTKPD